MKCLSPSRISLKGTKAEKYYNNNICNGVVYVPCGRCFACLQNIRNEWIFRLLVELEHAKTAYFVTLTYDDQYLYYNDKGYITLNKDHVKSFIHSLINEGQKRYKTILKENGKSYQDYKNERLPLKYFLVGEYGSDTGRPHYHFIIFNYPSDNVELVNDCLKLWKKCEIIDIRYLSIALCKYVTKYMIKDVDQNDFIKNDIVPPFRLMSKGLGYHIINKNLAKGYIQGNINSIKFDKYYSIPRYIKNKLEKIIYDKYASNDENFYYRLHSNSYIKSQINKIKIDRIKYQNSIFDNNSIDSNILYNYKQLYKL